jgi:hypothetical protein
MPSGLRIKGLLTEINKYKRRGAGTATLIKHSPLISPSTNNVAIQYKLLYRTTSHLF